MVTKDTTRPRPAGLGIEVVTDPKERRRLQNRIAQRNSRELSPNFPLHLIREIHMALRQ